MGKKRFSRREFVKGAGIVGAGLILSPSLIGCGNGKKVADPAKDPVRITWAVSEQKELSHIHELGCWEFAERIQNKSNGEIVVDIYPGGQLGEQRVALEKTQMGQVQACQHSSANAAQFVPEYNLLDLPYLVKDRADWEKLHDTGVLEDTLGKAAEKRGFKILFFAPAGWRVLFLGRRVQNNVRVPDDLQGLKIRTTASVAEQRVFEMCGAAPTPIPWGECYTAIQQGVADGLNVGAAPTYNNRIHEVCRFVSELNLYLSLDMHSMNLDWYNSLPRDYQELIDTTAREITSWQLDRQLNEQLPKINQMMLDDGVEEIYTPTPEEYKIWFDKVGHHLPVWDSLKQDWGKDIYDRMAKTVS
ncbi:MAG: TRAP transporter substrate-binding protein [Bacillota bacterium]